MVGSPAPFRDRTNDVSKKRSILSNIWSPSTRKPKKKLGRAGETPVSIKTAKNHQSALAETSPNRRRHAANDSPTASLETPSTATPSRRIFTSPLRRSSSGRKDRRRRDNQNTTLEEESPRITLFTDVTENLPTIDDRSSKERLKAEILERLERHLKSDDPCNAGSSSPLVTYLRSENDRRGKGWLRKTMFDKGSGKISSEESSFIKKFTPLDHSTHSKVLSILSVSWAVDKRTIKKHLPDPVVCERFVQRRETREDGIFSHATSMLDESLDTNQQSDAHVSFVAANRQQARSFGPMSAPSQSCIGLLQHEQANKRQMLYIAWTKVYPMKRFPTEVIVGGSEWSSSVSNGPRPQPPPPMGIGVSTLVSRQQPPTVGISTLSQQPHPIRVNGRVPVPHRQTRSFTSTINPTQEPATNDSCPCLESHKRGVLPRKCGRNILRDEKLPNGHIVRDIPGNYVLVSSGEDGKNRIARDTLAVIESFLTKRRQVCMTMETKLLYGSFATAFPTTPAEQQAMFISMGRYTFLKEIAAQMPPDCRYLFEGYFDIRKAFRISPSARTIETSCVKELAIQQAFVFSCKISRIPYPALQSDKGPDASEVQVASYWDPDDKTATIRGSPAEFIMGLQRSGKTAEDSAEAIDFNLSLLGLEREAFKFASYTGDSGGSGDAERFTIVLQGIGRFFGWGLADSCGHHDTQSIFRLPTLHLFGTGGIGKRNPPQCMHLLYSVFKTFAELQNWKDLVRVLYKELYGEGQEPPKELLKFIQNPLMTRWWTLGDVSCFLMRYWRLFVRIAQTVVAYAKSKSEQHNKASELWSLLEEPGIKAGVAFISGFTKSYLNPNMAWYGMVDPNIGVPGKLAFHRTARYFLQVKTLEALANGGWKNDSKFDDFQQAIQLVQDEKEKEYMEKTPDKFFEIALDQLHKHTKPYVNSPRLLRAAFGEKRLAIPVARLLLGQNLVRENEIPGTFVSPMQGRAIIELSQWNDFLVNGTSDCIDELRGGELVDQYRPCLEKIANGFDLWNEDDNEALVLSTRVLVQFGMNSQSQQNNERAVGQVSRLRESGKSEIVAQAYLIGGNKMTASSVLERQYRQMFGTGFDDDDEDDEDDSDSDSDVEMDDNEGDHVKKPKKKRLRGWRRGVLVETNACQLQQDYRSIWMSKDVFECSALRATIEKGFEDKSKTFFAKRKDEDLAKLRQASKEAPKSNAVVRKRGYDMPARARDMIPLSSIKGNHGHLPLLIQELRYRHIPFYFVYNPVAQSTNRPISFPLPEGVVTGLDDKGVACSFDSVGITALKNLLMADQERLYQTNDDDDDIEYEVVGLVNLKYRSKYWNEVVEMVHEKEFVIDVPLRAKPIDHFERKDVRILKEGLQSRFKSS